MYIKETNSAMPNRKKNQLIFFLCFCKGFFTPRKPIHGIVGMLKQRRRFFVYQSLGIRFEFVTGLINVAKSEFCAFKTALKITGLAISISLSSLFFMLPLPVLIFILSYEPNFCFFKIINTI